MYYIFCRCRWLTMYITNILVWNVRGLNRKAHRDSVRQLIAMARPDVVCLQETKVHDMTTGILLSSLGRNSRTVLFVQQWIRGVEYS